MVNPASGVVFGSAVLKLLFANPMVVFRVGELCNFQAESREKGSFEPSTLFLIYTFGVLRDSPLS